MTTLAGPSITGGTLKMGAADAIPTSGDVTLSGAGTLDLSGFATLVRSLNGSSGAVTNSGTLTDLQLTGTASGATFSGNIGGAIALAAVGSNTIQILGGTNTYSGQTTVNTNAILRISSPQALGATGAGNDTVVAEWGRLELSGGIAVTNENLTIQGRSLNNCGALQSFSGYNVWAGNITVLGSTNSTRVGARDGATLEVSGVLSGGEGGGIATRGETTNTTVVLSGSNTYTGDTIVYVNTLRLGADNTLPATTVVSLPTIAAGLDGKLDLNGHNQSVAGLSVAFPTTIVGSSSTTSDATLTINGPTNTTFGGTMQDSLAGGTRKVGLTVAGGSFPP